MSTFAPVPTLVVWGDKDATNDVSMAHELHDGIKDSKLVVFEGIGHGVPARAAPRRPWHVKRAPTYLEK